MEKPDLSRTGWRASSYSGTNGNCMEVAVAWRTSSCSGTNGECVEVAADARVLVRDTKDRRGPALAFPPAAWRRFGGQLKVGPLPGADGLYVPVAPA